MSLALTKGETREKSLESTMGKKTASAMVATTGSH
jgi:hypothetical protein